MKKEEKIKQAKQCKRRKERNRQQRSCTSIWRELQQFIQQLLKKWEHDTDEKKELSFVADNESDGDVEIDINKCTKYDVAFKKNKNDFYGCDHCL